MLRVFSVLALASGLALATGPPAVAEVMSQGMPSQGMPMGGMKTTKDLKDLDDQKKKAAKPEEAPNQAQAPKPERVTPTYRDTTEDRIMREKTDDGAHDRNDTQM